MEGGAHSCRLEIVVLYCIVQQECTGSIEYSVAYSVLWVIYVCNLQCCKPAVEVRRGLDGDLGNSRYPMVPGLNLW